MNQFKLKVQEYISNQILMGEAVSAGGFLQQYLLSTEIYNTLSTESPEKAATYLSGRQIGGRMEQAAAVAAEWMPQIKG